MVRIRLSRAGRTHLAHWRIGVFDQKTRRDGKAIEHLGFYAPHREKEEEQISINAERARYWLGKGAQPSETVANLLRKSGIEV